jgi:hypothetical protein
MEARRTVAVIAGIAAALMVTGCGAGSDRPAPAPAATALVIRVNNNVAGTAVLTLRCDPPGARSPTRRQRAIACPTPHQEYSSIPGHSDAPAVRCHRGMCTSGGARTGRRIHVDIATCLTPQVRLIRLLGITTNQLLQVIDADH